MEISIGKNSEVGFRGAYHDRELQACLEAEEFDAGLDPEAPRPSADSSVALEALKPNPTNDGHPRIDITDGSRGEQGASGGGPWRGRLSARILLMVLLVTAAGVVAPLAWSYLQSYES